MAPRDSNRNSSVAAVGYLRRSTARQEKSLADQRSAIKHYSVKHGYHIVRWYTDDAVSGDRTDKRTGFQQMQHDAANGRDFAVILCWDQDRFGRFDLLEAGMWIEPIRRAGVRMETVTQGRIDWNDLVGQLTYSVQQMGKAQFLRDLSANVCRAQLEKAKAGKGTGGNRIPFGYYAKQVRNEKGRLLESRLEIDPDKATIVHRIFEDFLAPGGTFRGVANGLNVDKVPTPSSMSNAWTDTAVKYILQNRKYLGLFIWGVQGTGSYRTAVNGEIEQRHKGQKATTGTPIIHEGKHKPIIDQATFDKVQAKMQLKPRRDSTPKTARKYLCTGLLRCGDCGGHMVGVKPTSKTGDYRYLCRKYQSAGKTACYCNSIPERPLVACLINKIQQHYATPKANKQLRAAVLKELERSNPKPKDTARLQSEIRSLDQKINGAEDVVLEAPQRLRAGLYRKLEQLTQKREHAQEQLARVAQHAHRRKENDKTVKQAMTTLKQLGELLHKADPDHVKNLLGEVVDRIELHFDHGSYGKIRRSTFREGMVYFRQDVLGSQVQSTA